MTTNNSNKATALPSLPSLPSTSKQRPMRPCGCGCSYPTQRTFVPGHDARLKGLIIRQVRGLMTNAEIAEWGGKGVAEAVTRSLKDAALLRRWNITVPEVEVEAAS